MDIEYLKKRIEVVTAERDRVQRVVYELNGAIAAYQALVKEMEIGDRRQGEEAERGSDQPLSFSSVSNE